MVDISISDGVATFELVGLHKLWALKSRLRIPLAHIREVRPDPTVTLGWWKGWRVPGTHLPGVIVAGTYYQDGRRTFWDVTRPEKAIVVELVNEPYDELIVDVPDPREAVNRLRSALFTRHA